MLAFHRHACVCLMIATALDSSAAHAQMARVSGTVTYRERSALPPTAEITVQLQDVSRADAPAIVVAEQTIASGGKQVPFAFELAYDPAAIQDRNTYAVRATIRDGGQLLFTTTEAVLVLTQGRPRTVDVIVERVSGDAGRSGRATDPPATLPNTGGGASGGSALLVVACLLVFVGVAGWRRGRAI